MILGKGIKSKINSHELLSRNQNKKMTPTWAMYNTNNNNNNVIRILLHSFFPHLRGYGMYLLVLSCGCTVYWLYPNTVLYNHGTLTPAGYHLEI